MWKLGFCWITTQTLGRSEFWNSNHIRLLAVLHGCRFSLSLIVNYLFVEVAVLLWTSGTDPINQVPGTYKVKQCAGSFTSTNSLCQSVPRYNISVVYSNPNNGYLGSIPYPLLFNQHLMICNPDIYTGCPSDYKCCMWHSQAQTNLWKTSCCRIMDLLGQQHIQTVCGC